MPDKSNNSKKCRQCRGIRRKVIRPPLPERKCSGCNRMFRPPLTHPNQKYHSKVCADRLASHIRRIRTEFVEEEVTLAKLEERDGPYCGICAGKIDMRLRYPNEKSATIDHIIPLSKDGKHRMSNCQLAHKRCNGKKYNHTSYRAFLFME